VWLNFGTTHIYERFVMDVHAPTNSTVQDVAVSAPITPRNLALGAQQANFDTAIRISTSLLGTPSIQCVYEYYPFVLKDDGGPLALCLSYLPCPRFRDPLVTLALLVPPPLFPSPRSFRAFCNHHKIENSESTSKSTSKEVEKGAKRPKPAACKSSCTTRMQDIPTIVAQRAMKDNGKTLHELKKHVPKKSIDGREHV
jgi:hypothetical protein